MSAHAYIQYADVPQQLIDSSGQIIDRDTGAKLIAFDGCPQVGELEVLADGRIQIEYSWARNVDLRHSLADWLTYHGIHFTVVM
ncbi:phage portal protein [Paraburkholderia sp. Cpub6]|uniref:phage portal protein n=1 Tax=Paraburkholderia sp. Cpub6 TaxID=2723094 RepID=UPI0016101898|nr:phage portal protein [Paraburkholderia sp. Cpub6]MBB5462893.1 hypothetical protein [Paraburkholderia sp. Cpub6]